MAKIKLTGESSGYVEISAGNAAGNNILETPTSGTRLVAHEGTQDVVLGGNLTVNGVLTYEDVTNIDSVGIITARSGIDIGTGVSITSPSSNVLTLGTNSVERLRITSGGSIGIGTDNPTSRLQVYRKTQFASNPIIQARSDNGSINELKFEIDGDGDAYFNGNVGVGTDNPNSRQLSVYGLGVNGTQIECRSTGGTSSGLSMYAGRNFEIQSTSSAEANYPNSFIVYDRNANGYRMAIDGSGRVLMPAQPSFFSRPPASYNLSAGANTIGGTWSDVHNIGSHFSNGTFTAPVAGTYQFDWAIFVQSETSRIDAYILINGTNVMREELTGYSGTSNKSASVHGCYYLSVDDNVTFGLHTQAGTNLYVAAAPWQYASGFLVG